ncbi:hypothetical protein KGF54_004295 [Candida jiufengensis]|uniref:uncharacterized protein n=1 Tax=Candida jiufengensis TaxID=497108 RepID=UPI002224B67D|nr:uncharacterized protein KGF54_004295 [Candida jiufengensis]KAI5951221.1 hypothetical protein KGF54_004295 [Candida jiufengensis]
MKCILILYLFSLIQSIKVNPFYNKEKLNLAKRFSTLNIVHHTRNDYKDLVQDSLQPYTVTHILSSNSIIFNENILNQEETHFIELSYSELHFRKLPPLQETVINEVYKWYPLGDCVTNNAGDKASYRQGWSIEVDFGIDYRLNYGGYFLNFGPGIKSEFIWAKGVGGDFSCDLNPGNTLQFAILFTKYEVDGIRYRSVGWGKWRKKVKFGDWKRFDKFETVGKNDIQIACFTDPRFLRCNRVKENKDEF